MKDVKQLFEKLDYELKQGELSGEITSLTSDSRKVEEGCLYICIKGASFDGPRAASEVVEKGAKVLVIQDDVELSDDARALNPVIVKVNDTREAQAYLSAAYFDYPADKLQVIGITGTKGKTTTTYMVKSILEGVGYKVGLIGTIEAIIGEERIPAANTTPESYTIQEYFKRMLDAGCTHVVMEVSSQGLMMHRVDGFTFDVGIFTNIEPDHIGPNEHESFEDYMECKSRLFKKCKMGIVNADDPHLANIIEGHTCQLMSYGFAENADLRADNVTLVHKPGYLGVQYDVSGAVNGEVEVDVPGKFSVYNSLTAIAICHYYNVSLEDMAPALKNAKVKGRIEMIHVSDRFTLMIDYAHNAMSLESLLTTMKDYRPGRLICLFGCGGNRSKLRRYEMGEVSGRFADLTIITSDNPRFEEPQAIIDDIKTGIAKTTGEYVEIVDRREAIKYAIKHAMEKDIIVLAGKGHEDYQEIKGKKYPMDERVLVAEVVEELKAEGWEA